MVGCDLAFEYSTVRETVRGQIDSVKNHLQGRIEADFIGEIIWDEHHCPYNRCKIIRRSAA